LTHTVDRIDFVDFDKNVT